jgi:AcrR family transcriptional regulator
MTVDINAILVSTCIDMNTTRGYTMTTRAKAVEATRERILRASFDLHRERLVTDFALGDIADRAGVSVQTVLRQFGSRDRLVDATFDYARELVVEERKAPAGDVPAAIRAIVDHYEYTGDGVLVLLAQESTQDFVRRITDMGRVTHRDWVEEVFGPLLADRSPDDRDALVDLLVVATDVYTWKLLRRDRGLSRAHTESRMTHLASALLAPHHPEP